MVGDLLLERNDFDVLRGEKIDFDLETFIELANLEKNISNKELKTRLNKIINNKISICNNCHLNGIKGDRKPIPPFGNIESPVVIIGEEPIVKKNNTETLGTQLILDKILASFQLTREKLYVTSIIKCIPQNKGNPTKEEIKLCNHFLESEIKIIKPRVIISLGFITSNYFTNGGSNEKSRGSFVKLKNGVWLMPTYDLKYLLSLESSEEEKSVKWSIWYDFNNALIKAKELCPDFTF